MALSTSCSSRKYSSHLASQDELNVGALAESACISFLAEPRHAMTPHDSVRTLRDVLGRVKPPFGQEDIHPELLRAGLTEDGADRAFKFTQIWCGRQLLAGIGVRFSPDYFWFNGTGVVVNRGQIETEPFYRAAQEVIATDFPTGSALSHLALSSADVHAVNELLNRGSQPSDLITSPAFLFTEMPTEAGRASAEWFMVAHMQSLRPKPPKKPWWRFW